ncbi:TPA: hypothetical protein I7682_18070 [Vibrio vulnificus]|nr:hypothetical protein [Vibrio vulnificus]
MFRKTNLKSEQGCTLVLVQEIAESVVVSTSYEVIDSQGNSKPYGSKVAALAAFTNRVYEAEVRLGISHSNGMGM